MSDADLKNKLPKNNENKDENFDYDYGEEYYENQSEDLDEILSEFAPTEADLYENITDLAQKYGVDVGDLPRLSEAEEIVKDFRDDSYYSEEDTDGYTEEYSTQYKHDEGEEDQAFVPLQEPSLEDDWRNPQKGRWKNRRKAKAIHENKEERPFFLVRILRFFLPWKGDNASLAASKVLMMTFLLILSVSAAAFGYSYYKEYYHPLIPTPTEVQVDINGETIDPRNKYGDIDFPEGLIDEFVDLYAANTDFVGYLSIYGKDGNLQAPVLQSSDNKFYAEHNFYKNESRLGNPFLDHNNDTSLLNANTVIYANNIAKAFKSSAFSDYKNLDTFKSQPIITYWSQRGVYYWKIYAVFVSNAKAEQDNGYIFYFNTLDFKDEISFEGYKNMLDQKRIYTTGVDLKYGDRLLTISAYDNEFEGAYTVMLARLVREGESLDVDTSLAFNQESPRYPQIWYDKKRKTNPYKDAENWHP